jgi:hypothetical protein
MAKRKTTAAQRKNARSTQGLTVRSNVQRSANIRDSVGRTRSQGAGALGSRRNTKGKSGLTKKQADRVLRRLGGQVSAKTARRLGVRTSGRSSG